MKIGIMGALFEEVSGICGAMSIERQIRIGSHPYFIGKINEVDCVLAHSLMGKVAAGSVATTLIHQFQVDQIIYLGAAGAVEDALNVGDVVVADTLYQHDMDARPLFPQFEVPLTKQAFFVPQTEEVARMEMAVNGFLNNLSTYISAEVLDIFSIHQPTVQRGAIASGDHFVQNAKHRENLHPVGQRVLAVEMEGAAVAQVCHAYQIPYLVTRIISDKADHSALIDYLAFCEQIASVYSTGILKTYLQLL